MNTIHTPLLKVYSDSHKEIYVKDETKQLTGAFKFRGVLNKFHSNDIASCYGVVTASTGNHGFAVAIIANEYKIPCIIVVSQDTPLCKIQNIAKTGASIKYIDGRFEECNAYAKNYATNHGYLYISSFDDEQIIEGHKQLFAEATENDEYDYCLCPIGGGGLVSAAIKYNRRLGTILGVENQTLPKMKLSLEQGRIVNINNYMVGISEGISIGEVGRIPFKYAKDYGLRVLLVSEEEIKNGIRFLNKKGITSEGAGAASVSAALKYPIEGKILCIVSGGNIDLSLLSQII